MKRGRPIRSEIRQNIVEILAIIAQGYGYQISKLYQELFPKCTREVIYYHLRKGVELGEFKLSEVKKEKGNFSWGEVVEKRYYALGPNANPQQDDRVREMISELQKQREQK